MAWWCWASVGFSLGILVTHFGAVRPTWRLVRQLEQMLDDVISSERKRNERLMKRRADR